MKPTTNDTLRTWRDNIPVTALYTAGLGGTIFLQALKERGQLVGTRCPTCQRTYLPAQQFCERCFAELTEQVRVKSKGEVVSFTQAHYDRDDNRLPAPITVAAVRLDGADTVLIHYLLRTPKPRIGARVRVLLKPKAKRTGSILDIAGFVPA